MKCALDMDGVLVDYYAGVCELFGHRPWPYFCRPGNWNFFDGEPMHLDVAQVAPKMGRDFYATLPWLPDGKKILKAAEEAFGRRNVFILTSPWDTEGCDQGKRDWIKINAPDYKRRTFIGGDKEELAHMMGVLFDDADKNCQKWIEAGGRALVVPRPWNSMHAFACMKTGAVLDHYFPHLFGPYRQEAPVAA